MSKSKSKRTGLNKHRNLTTQEVEITERPLTGRTPGWLKLVVVFALFGLSTYYICEHFVFARIPSTIVGKWGVEGGPQDGATLHFYRNGTFKAKVNVQGKEGLIEARVEVADERIHILSNNPNTGKTEVQTHVIKSLTEEEMVLQDQKGTVFKLVRLE